MKGKGELRIRLNTSGLSKWLHCGHERRAAQCRQRSGEDRRGRQNDRTGRKREGRHHHRDHDCYGRRHRCDCGWWQRRRHWRRASAALLVSPQFFFRVARRAIFPAARPWICVGTRSLARCRPDSLFQRRPAEHHRHPANSAIQLTSKPTRPITRCGRASLPKTASDSRAPNPH